MAGDHRRTHRQHNRIGSSGKESQIIEGLRLLMGGIGMAKVAAEQVRAGIGLKTWFGTHTVIKILPYAGPFDHILNILVFSNGKRMSNEKYAMYELAQ